MHKSLVASVLWPAVNVLLPLPTSAQDVAPSWHQYVRAPKSSIVRPAAVVSGQTMGDVENAEGLVTDAATMPTVLTRGDATSANASLVVDFGQNVVGQLMLEFAGSTNGSGDRGFPGVRLAFSEALEFLTDRSDYTRSDRAQGDPPQLVTTGTDQIAVKNDPYIWEDIWGCEYDNKVCSDGLHGFRYVRISLDAIPTDAPYTSAYGQVSISSVSLRWSGYLGTPDTYTGWFECSDADLTQWWYDGVYTVETNTDIFRTNDTEPRGAVSDSLVGKLVLHDGAKRDRDPYMGDLAVASLTSYLSHSQSIADATLNVLEDLAAHQRAEDGWIPPASINHYTLPLFDYPLYWVTCSWDYVLYTGNTSYLDAYYGVMVRVLDTYYPLHTDNATQLLVRPPNHGDFAFLDREGIAAYYNALYVLALTKAADLADLLSSNEDATRWRQRAAEVSTSFHTTFWDASAAAYFDQPSDNNNNAHAQDGNSLAILAGIPPSTSTSNNTIANQILTHLTNHHARPYGNALYDNFPSPSDLADRVYPFTTYFEAGARFQSHDVAGALDLLRRTWGHMAAQDPGTTHWEGIGAQGAKYQGGTTSLSHGWSTGVTPLLTTYVLGVRPVQPGFAVWAVDPVVGEQDDNYNDITWAQGVVPTPYGPLAVSWEIDESGRVVVTVDAPEGTRGMVGGEASRTERVEVQGGKGKRIVTLVERRL